jgi:hypothetical protein
MLKVTVSGSFHRGHLQAISRAVYELTDLGVRVLSPADPRIVAAHEEFLFVASDRFRSISLVQDRHLECIRASDFLWVVAPDGYLGVSASMEIGFAVANGIPIFSLDQVSDLTLRQYVRKVERINDVLNSFRSCRADRVEGFLINPHDSIEFVRNCLDKIENAMRKVPVARERDVAPEIYAECKAAAASLVLPS